jgi:hypothetical protein
LINRSSRGRRPTPQRACRSPPSSSEVSDIDVANRLWRRGCTLVSNRIRFAL